MADFYLCMCAEQKSKLFFDSPAREERIFINVCFNFLSFPPSPPQDTAGFPSLLLPQSDKNRRLRRRGVRFGLRSLIYFPSPFLSPYRYLISSHFRPAPFSLINRRWSPRKEKKRKSFFFRDILLRVFLAYFLNSWLWNKRILMFEGRKIGNTVIYRYKWLQVHGFLCHIRSRVRLFK